MRSRIYTNRLLILQLAKNLGLIYLPDELVRVKINGQPEKYFFLEKKFDNKFMEVEKKSSYKRVQYRFSEFQSADKSLIRATDTDPYTEAELVQHLTSGLLDAGISEAHLDSIISRYIDINNAISNRSPNVLRFFDPNYISNYDALSLIMGFVGHSWMKSNFFVYHNQANGLFYPSVTRDSVPSRLIFNDEPLEKQIISSLFF